MVAKLDAVEAGLRRFVDELFAAAVDQFDVIARETASRAVGGTMTLHGRGGRRTPVTLGTRSVIVNHGNDAVATIVGTPTYAWVWLEKGTQPHEIGGRRRDGKVTFLHGAGYEHPIAGPMTHPGSRGKGTWTATLNTFHAQFPTLTLRVKGKVFHAS